ncbi:hypothetical protein D5272_01795 [bacterium D16-76]|nr:hypothetical protein [bacterium D16-76]
MACMKTYLTRRQVYFYNQKNKKFYISEEFYGDRDEFERFGLNDVCTKSWEEILEELRTIKTLRAFLSKVSEISGYYKSGIEEKIGTRIKVGQYKDIPFADEVYRIDSGCSGVFLDTQHSYKTIAF